MNSLNIKKEQELFNLVIRPDYVLSFETFVQNFFPWGEEGTPLANFPRIRSWQLDFIRSVDRYNIENTGNPNPKIYKGAVAGGRGIGKSALNAWLMLWFMSTRPGGSVICVANSETQLKTTLWADTSRWLSMLPNRHWFEMQSLSMHPASWFADSLLKTSGIDSKLYSIQCRTYSEERPGAFVGMHNPIGTMVIVDEGSDTPFSITRSINGFFTELNSNRFWVMSSNPRRLSGHFFDIFNKPLEDWNRFQVDTRTVEGIDPSFHQGLIDSYGMDSDIVRVDVLGQFPLQDESSFIPQQYIQEALERVAHPDVDAPLIMGCDVSEEGGDKTVVMFRRGNIIENTFWWSKTPFGVTKRKILDLITEHKPDAIVVDANGSGAVVSEYLKDNGCFVEEIKGQRRSDFPDRYKNKRAELYDLAKQAILASLQLPTDPPELAQELRSISAHTEITSGLLAIEPKRQAGTKYGVISPDFVDALSYTYAVNPPRNDYRNGFGLGGFKYEAEPLLVDRRGCHR